LEELENKDEPLTFQQKMAFAMLLKVEQQIQEKEEELTQITTQYNDMLFENEC